MADCATENLLCVLGVNAFVLGESLNTGQVLRLGLCLLLAAVHG